MKLWSIILLAGSLLSNSSIAAECPVESDTEHMYSIFFRTAYKPNPEEPGTYIYQIPDKTKGNIAWACLEKAASLNSCPAIRSMEMYYKHGVGLKTFGIAANPKKAEFYANQRIKYCNNNT
tara:strand:+ start:56 stop:418 length:363 start_codon:yes stop_codon:yes gene_type:complete